MINLKFYTRNEVTNQVYARYRDDGEIFNERAEAITKWFKKNCENVKIHFEHNGFIVTFVHHFASTFVDMTQEFFENMTKNDVY